LVDDMSTIASGIGFRLPEVIVLVVIVILIGMTIAVGVLVFYGYRKLLRFLRT
jgi:NhaP-type Na+/H+ or K+/H+ antiporter